MKRKWKISVTCSVLFQKISIVPPPKGLEFPGGMGGGGFSKTKTSKEMYQKKLEFLEGQEGVFEKIHPRGRCGYFLELHNHCTVMF